MSLRGSDGAGEEIPLTGFSSPRWPAVLLQPGATGLDLPPLELHADDSPNLDGGIYRSSRRAAREIMLPLYLHAIDRRTLRELKHRLAAALDPANGPSVLAITEGDAQPRYLRCYYKGGLDGAETAESAGFTWAKYNLQLIAYDPYYYGPDLRVADWTFGANAAFLDPGRPLYPLRLSQGVLDTQVTVTNPGDVPSWPRWEITGPIRSFTLTSPSGASFGITPASGNAVPDGRVLTVDTRPGYKTLLDDAGMNYWPTLDPAPQLWAVPPGRSAIGLGVVAAGGTANVRLTLRPRYMTY